MSRTGVGGRGKFLVSGYPFNLRSREWVAMGEVGGGGSCMYVHAL